MRNSDIVYNFGAGPACLPKIVLDRIQSDIPHWHMGMSVMEISHRSKPFMDLMCQIEARLKTLLCIPPTHEILFMHGGARTQFAAIGLNLLYNETAVDYLITGHWSLAAFDEIQKYISPHILADGKDANYTKIPTFSDKNSHPESRFLHYTDNETIHGVEFHKRPQTEKILIADMTSNILTKSIDWAKYGLVYASAQKNLGIAGVTVVVIDKTLLNKANPLTPSVMNYQVIAEHRSLYNTCPTFALYVLGLMLEWVESMGGVDYFDTKAEAMSKRLYQFIDNSRLYTNPVHTSDRSRMNIPFHLSTPELEADFLEQAKSRGLMALGGHRAVGGCRASFYNPMPEQGVDKLLAFMQEYEMQHSS